HLLFPSSSPSLLSTALSSILSFYGSGHLRHLHSFPTRRSSDLWPNARRCSLPWKCPQRRSHYLTCWQTPGNAPSPAQNLWCNLRSEEHTSELQSRFDLVCRLLLEKKKKKSR